MRTLKFNKEEDNKWYVDLPEWNGNKAELEMVCGADTMLDIISQGENTTHITLSTEPFNDVKYQLSYLQDSAEGADYLLTSELHTFDVWLCRVTKFVFGELPKVIYLK